MDIALGVFNELMWALDGLIEKGKKVKR